MRIYNIGDDKFELNPLFYKEILNSSDTSFDTNLSGTFVDTMCRSPQYFLHAIAITLMTLSSGVVLGQPTAIPPAYLVTGNAAVSEPLINEVVGTYKYRKVVKVDGEEDRNMEIKLDVLPRSATRLYAELFVPNRNLHNCTYRGIFEFKGSNEFIAIDDVNDPKSCVMEFKINANSIVLIDQSHDRKQCSIKAGCHPNGSVDRIYFSKHIKEKTNLVSNILTSEPYIAEVERFREQFKR